MMEVKSFRPTERKRPEETQLRPKGRLSAFNDKKARQPSSVKAAMLSAEVAQREGRKVEHEYATSLSR